jgi:hypothetical protein
MMRAAPVREHQLRYREDLLPSEDYEMWTQILQHGEGMNLQDELLEYRVHAGQISNERRDTQLAHHDQVVEAELNRWLNPLPAPAVRLALRQIWQGGVIRDLPDGVDLVKVCKTVNELVGRFEEKFGVELTGQYAGRRSAQVWRRLFWKAGLVSKAKLGWALMHSGLLAKVIKGCV